MFRTSISFIVATLLTTTTAFASSDALAKIKTLTIFQEKSLKINDFKEHESLYQIKGIAGGKNPFSAYITKDFKEVVFGRAFDANTKKALTIPIDIEKYKKNAEYTIGNGKDEYILFTDPECPFCHKLENILPLLGKNTKFYVYLFPLSFHKNAKAMSYYIMSQKTNALKAKAMHEIANKSILYKNAKFSITDLDTMKTKLEKEQQIASEIGVSGTPSIFDVLGRKVEWPTLLDKYNIEKPIDMAGVQFLEKNNLAIDLNKNSKKEKLYIFSTLDSKAALLQVKKIIKKHSNKSLKLFLKIEPQAKNKDELLSIYAQKDNKSRLKLLNKVLDSKKVSSEIIKSMKKTTNGDSAKYLSVPYIMKKMNIKSSQDVVVLDTNGKIIK